MSCVSSFCSFERWLDALSIDTTKIQSVGGLNVIFSRCLNITFVEFLASCLCHCSVAWWVGPTDCDLLNCFCSEWRWILAFFFLYSQWLSLDLRMIIGPYFKHTAVDEFMTQRLLDRAERVQDSNEKKSDFDSTRQRLKFLFLSSSPLLLFWQYG